MSCETHRAPLQLDNNDNSFTLDGIETDEMRGKRFVREINEKRLIDEQERFRCALLNEL